MSKEIIKKAQEGIEEDKMDVRVNKTQDLFELITSIEEEIETKKKRIAEIKKQLVDIEGGDYSSLDGLINNGFVCSYGYGSTLTLSN
jgi:predicted house-cleaning noncanonical NTP pyrophosphatase (MazG superfamily)